MSEASALLLLCVCVADFEGLAFMFVFFPLWVFGSDLYSVLTYKIAKVNIKLQKSLFIIFLPFLLLSSLNVIACGGDEKKSVSTCDYVISQRE